MPVSNNPMIQVRGLTKRYGEVTAVRNLSFDVMPGRVTGFLGPNGAGKTTTMRLILGLGYPDAGTARIDGKPYASLAYPMREVGALLDARAVHTAAVRPTTICCAWPRPITCPGGGSARCSSWSA